MKLVEEIRGWRRLILISLTVLPLVVVDQGSKLLAVVLLEGRGVISFYNDSLRFVLAENTGGFLSLGAALPPGVRNIIFVCATALLLLLFLFYVLFDRRQTRGTAVSASMIIGGGTGNLIDRIVNDGAVIDFVNIGIGRVRTGIFNIADMAVLSGCLLLLLYSWRGYRACEANDRKGQ